MKTLKSSWKTCLGVVVGFVLGTWLFQTGAVKANPQETGLAHVYIVPVAMLDAKSPVPQNLPGARIAGISCIPKPTHKFPDAAVCYVATALID
jgi:hypothetical protein